MRAARRPVDWNVVVLIATTLGLFCGVCAAVDPTLVPSTSSGAFYFCSSDGCAAENVTVEPKSFGEYDPQGNRVAGVVDFGKESVYALQSAKLMGNSTSFEKSVNTPTDDSTFSCETTASCGVNPAVFNHAALLIPVNAMPAAFPTYAGAESVVHFQYSFERWTVKSASNDLVLELQISLNLDSASPVLPFQESSVDGAKRFKINNNLFMDFPLTVLPMGPPIAPVVNAINPPGRFRISISQNTAGLISPFLYSINLVSHLQGAVSSSSGDPVVTLERVNHRTSLYAVKQYSWNHCVAVFMLLGLTFFAGAGACLQEFSVNLDFAQIVP